MRTNYKIKNAAFEDGCSECAKIAGNALCGDCADDMTFRCTYESVYDPQYSEKDDKIVFKFTPEDGGYDMQVRLKYFEHGYKQEEYIDSVQELEFVVNGGWERKSLMKFLRKVVDLHELSEIIK